MESVTLPEIYCPFPSALNPHAEDSERYAVEWADRFGLAGVDDSNGIARARLGHLSGYVYPTVSKQALRVGTAWFDWLMLYDDIWLDKRARVEQLTPERVAAFHERAMAIMGGAPADAGDEPLLACLEDIRASFLQLRPDWDMRPFLSRFHNYLQSGYWEAANLWDGVVPRLATYVNMRRQTGSLFATYQVGALMKGIRLTPEVRGHAALEQLEIMANNYTCWQNDVYSFLREYTDGTVNNLVIVLRHEHDCGFQEAVDRAAAMCRAEVEAYVELRERLPRIGLPVDDELESYLRLLESWMRGLMDWTAATRRYELEGLSASRS
jgi:5-epi-alpha-selinene synthase